MSSGRTTRGSAFSTAVEAAASVEDVEAGRKVNLLALEW